MTLMPGLAARTLSTTCGLEKGAMPKNERRAQQNLRAPENWYRMVIRLIFRPLEA
ncbi:hypothetical protein ACWGTO_03245 [Mesorhizobium sp. PL10]